MTNIRNAALWVVSLTAQRALRQNCVSLDFKYYDDYGALHNPFFFIFLQFRRENFFALYLA